MSEQPHNPTGANDPHQQPPHQQGAPQPQGQPYQQGQPGPQQGQPPYQQGQPGPQQPYQQGHPGQPGHPQQPGQPPHQQGFPQQPGQPPHQQGFPPQGRPQQQYQPQQPGQPQQFGQPQPAGSGPATQSASPSFDIGALIKIWVTSFKQFFTGGTNAGLDTVRSSNDSPTTKWFWAVAALVNAVLMILVAVVGVLKYNDRLFDSLGIAFLMAFFIPIVLSGVYISTRALTFMGLFKVQKRAIGFHQSANIAAVGFVISAPVIVLALIAMAIDAQLFSIIFMVGLVFTVVFAEVAVYEELKKQTLPESATILHAAFTAVWVSLITYLAIELVSDRFYLMVTTILS